MGQGGRVNGGRQNGNKGVRSLSGWTLGHRLRFTTPMFQMLRAGTLAAYLLLIAGPMSAWAQEACPSVVAPPLALRKARQTFVSGKEVVIVALGSSSTEGWMASNVGNSYPAQLQMDLTQAFPRAHFAIINRGIGGQDAKEELPRLDADAIAVKPDLVIWQVGANGAMENADPANFKNRMTEGIGRLKAAGIDVVLMDNQRSPAILASPEHAIIEQALAEVGAKEDVPVFSRGALMDAWKQAGMGYDRFLAHDGVHMNDYGYRCVAEALANSLARGFNAGEPARVAVASHTVN